MRACLMRGRLARVDFPLVAGDLRVDDRKEAKMDTDKPLGANWISGEPIGYVGSHFDS